MKPFLWWSAVLKIKCSEKNLTQFGLNAVLDAATWRPRDPNSGPRLEPHQDPERPDLRHAVVDP